MPPAGKQGVGSRADDEVLCQPSAAHGLSPQLHPRPHPENVKIRRSTDSTRPSNPWLCGTPGVEEGRKDLEEDPPPSVFSELNEVAIGSPCERGGWAVAPIMPTVDQ